MLLDELQAIVGAGNWAIDAAAQAPFLSDRRGTSQGSAAIVVQPESTAQVAAIVRACAQAGTSIVAQGGNTGHCGGGIPDTSGDQVLLSLNRMRQIRKVDAENFSMTVEAGCILAVAQQAAAKAERLLPLSLAAEGSCQIGGNIATNAGGINVIRYGNAREQVLGLEVVLADGSIWDGLRALRKDNAGYDMKQVFIGSEGTLGIITAATLRLFPQPNDRNSALVAVASPAAAVHLLGRVRAALADQLVAFELISARAMRFATAYLETDSGLFNDAYPWYVLFEAAGTAIQQPLEVGLSKAIEAGIAADAIIAKNGQEADQLWRLRHAISDAQRAHGVSLKHDVSVPIDQIERFVTQAEERITRLCPEARIVAFGHVGDGNLHYNVTQPVGMPAETFRALGLQLSNEIYDLVAAMNGSFAAEHGIGRSKRDLLSRYRDVVEVDLMRSLKSSLDPQNLLNPGKVIC